MFLRLYNDPSVNSYLEDGGYKVKYYYNSLGSLDIMEAVSSAALVSDTDSITIVIINSKYSAVSDGPEGLKNLQLINNYSFRPHGL